VYGLPLQMKKNKFLPRRIVLVIDVELDDQQLTRILVVTEQRKPLPTRGLVVVNPQLHFEFGEDVAASEDPLVVGVVEAERKKIRYLHFD
jgi:hypothetical protein